MQIADLDRRITLENQTRLSNDYGEETVSYSTYREVWAKVDWQGGGINEESAKITATGKVVFYIRNLDLELLTTNTRIEFDDGVDSQYYYIHVINQIEGREQFLEILTEHKY